MIKVILSGCCGKMGQVITSMVKASDTMQIVAGIDAYPVCNTDYPLFSQPKSCDIKGDVIIDFSRSDALYPLLDFAVSTNTPLVIATTGHSAEDMEQIYKASEKCPIFKSGNMSLGVNLMIDLLKISAKIFGNSFDVEIIEKHHNQKIDAPSGTALMLADAINSVSDNGYDYIYDRHLVRAPRTKREIGIHTVRGGTIVGEHSVIFAGYDETFEIKHIAQSRQVFATGTLRAAQFIYDKAPGFYSMHDMISLEQAVTQASVEENTAVITLNNIKADSNCIVNAFTVLANQKINIDMISQTTPNNGLIDISFSLPLNSLDSAVSALKTSIDPENINAYNNVCKLTVEGTGMEHYAGAAAQFLSVLNSLNVPVFLITTSETKIACCIPKADSAKALEAIKDKFKI